MSSIIEELSCPEHEEADTKIVYHACKINDAANIVIRTVDTDIAAIMLGHMHHLNDGLHVWMLIGTGNNLRYVDLTKIHEQLGESICKSLPGLHAITGCDYNPAFFRRAKSKPFKILKNYVEFQEALMYFGHSEIMEDNNKQHEIFNVIQSLLCYLYNVGNLNDVDAARLQIFIDSYTVSDVNEAFNNKKLRNFDASCLPPCKSELFQQFLRANYICSIWNNAHLKIPTAYEPVNYGWILEKNQYYFKWFEGDQLPNYVSESLQQMSETNEGDIDNDQCEDWS
ncbi:jg27480, partial [Pararge aegeria aegeria]